MTKRKTIVEQELAALGYQQQLKRSLTVGQLTAFGLNYMIPIAPAVIFGLILVASGGSVALPFILAGICMSFTAMSYTILLRNFPAAGSLYSYVSRGWNPFIGFISGWTLMLDYILIPTIAAMSAAIYIRQLFPHIPYELCLFVFTVGAGLVNIFGIELMAKMGFWLLVIGEIVIFVGFAVWTHAVAYKGMGVGHLLSLEPFHFTNISTLSAGVAIAVLSYLGFDAITTLSEEAVNPKRDIPRAIFFTLIIGGTTMFLTGYLAMLVIPNWQEFIHQQDWVNATLFYVMQMTGGKWFASFYTAGFLLAMAVFSVVASAAASRLLFAMGRDRVIPKNIFGAVNQRWKTPHWSILLIVLLEFTLGSLFKIGSVAELVDYGALLGFVLLNMTVIWLYFIRRPAQFSQWRYWVTYGFMPLVGAIVMAWVFLHLHPWTLIIGSAWLIIGTIVMMINPQKFTTYMR